MKRLFDGRCPLWWIGLALLLWFASAVTGYLVTPNASGPSHLPEVGYLPMSPDQITFARVASNNLQVILYQASGVVLFGIPAFISLISNGLVLGISVRQALILGVPWGSLLRHTAPHSVELLGIWIAGGVGLQGIYWGLQFIRNQSVPSSRALLIIGLALLCSMLIILVAAWLEVHVSLRHI